MEEIAEACCVKHAVQKARKVVEAKARKKTKKQRLAKKKDKRKWMEYLQQLWNKVLAEDTTLLESTKGFQTMESKCKKIILEDKKK